MKQRDTVSVECTFVSSVIADLREANQRLDGTLDRISSIARG